MTTSSEKRFDVHEAITANIINALETAADTYTRPWIKVGGCNQRPVNVASGKPYNGVNIVSLWVAAMAHDLPSPLWGTYRQWQERGLQVRKGEKSSLVVFYKPLEAGESDAGDTSDAPKGPRLVARASRVFNAAQVDGFGITAPALPAAEPFDPIPRAEAFVAATKATIQEGGDTACFVPSLDVIKMPDRVRFTGTETMDPAEAFYATLCHELTHWSGAKARLNRDLSGRFGSEAYAMEELVAELSAAFLCADLGLSPVTRPDHAAYIASWLRVLKNDKRAIFTAASKASEAANWLMAHQGHEFIQEAA